MALMEVASQPNVGPHDTGRRAYLALAGCSILQLPIWGFSASYGVFQEHYSTSPDFDNSNTGAIGTTLIGIIYISMPFLFALLTQKYAHLRRTCAVAGIVLSSAGLLLSSFATKLWQLVLTQGVVHAVGSSLLYCSTTIYIDEWFLRRKGFAYGVMLSTKSAVGTAAPILFGFLLSRLGSKTSLQIWVAIVLVTSLPNIFLLRPRRSTLAPRLRRNRRVPLHFLRHSTFYSFQIANIIFSASYSAPQTYLASFATSVLGLSAPTSSLILASLNAPSIIASYWFGVMSDGNSAVRGHQISVSAVTFLSAVGACLPVFLLWGFASVRDGAGIALLALFAVVYGFFAGGYSATWGGIVKEVEKEGNDRSEAVDTSVVFGLLNGGRGIGYVVGGLVGVELVKIGPLVQNASWAYGSKFGSLILFAGLGAACGGSSILWKAGKALMK